MLQIISHRLKKSLKNGKAWVVIMMLIGSLMVISNPFINITSQHTNSKIQRMFTKDPCINKIIIHLCKYYQVFMIIDYEYVLRRDDFITNISIFQEEKC